MGDAPRTTDAEEPAIDLLHVEDDPAFARMAKRFLTRSDPSLEVHTETDPGAALDRLDGDAAVDCVLSDYDMPGTTGIELLEAVRERHPDLPFVLFTGKGGEEVASEAFSAGATDYFRKPTDSSEYEVLAERIGTVVEKYRTEQRLERSEERYRRLVETAPVPIVVHRGDEIVFANQAAADFMSVDDPEALVGTDPLQYLETDDRELVHERIQQLLSDEPTTESIEERYVDTEGNVRRALVAGSATELDGERAVQAVIRDVTEHREREQELQRYRSLVEAMGDGVYALDAEGRFEMVNERMTELSGYDREELLGRHASEVMTEEGLERSERAIQSLLDSAADSVTVEVTGRRADGEVVPRELTLTLQPTEPGEAFAGTVGVVHDITDRRERERELEQKNEQLEAFAEVVSHDLQNPLSVVRGHAELARDLAGEDADGKLVARLDAIIEAADRMAELTDDLLSLAKQGEPTGDPEPVAVGPLARRVWGTLETPAATLEVDDPGRVEADPTRLEQLLANLLENAVEHGSTNRGAAPDDAVHGTDEGGGPTGTATDGGDGRLTVTVRGTADGFAVVDDGEGIPPDERETVFERGYSTGSGTGFGLAIVRTVAEAHGWSVTVGESAAGGARFEVHTAG